MSKQLDILVPSFQPGTTSGGNVLKSLQNDSLPLADLLVREAVQNSTDAAIGIEKDYSRIAFNIGEFHPKAFNERLTYLTDYLNERHPEGSAKYLEIRDSLTTGMTGPVLSSEALDNPGDHGNYYKLVFESGREQTNSKAGGSWGYGKSVYYRAGEGVVVFYSRIKDPSAPGGTGHSSRLIIALVERDDSDHELLKRHNRDSIGLAWWGRKDSRYQNDILPITDENEIDSILDLFGVKRFDDGECGTSIIIPYINTERLLHGVIPEDTLDDSEFRACHFKDDLAEYLTIAIQRWYAPRLHNRSLEQLNRELSETDANDSHTYKWLRASVNDNTIRRESMRKVFLLVQDLYNTALFNNYGLEYHSKDFPEIRCSEVPSTKVYGNPNIAHGAGTVAFIRSTLQNIGMENSVISPYTLMRVFAHSAMNMPVVMFARTPGLVLDYKADGSWVKGDISPSEEGESLFAFFVPDCDSRLRGDVAVPEFRNVTLGEYLRRNERSDHMDWEDPSGMSLMRPLRTAVNRKVHEALDPFVEDLPDGTTSRFSGFLGRLLLPSTRYERQGGGPKVGGGGSRTSAAKSFYLFEMDSIDEQFVYVRFSITPKEVNRSAAFGYYVETDGGSALSPKQWASDIGTEYPLRLVEIRDCTARAGKDGFSADFSQACTIDSRETRCDLAVIKMVGDTGAEDVYDLAVESFEEEVEVEGVLVLEYSERRYSFDFKEIASRGETA